VTAALAQPRGSLRAILQAMVAEGCTDRQIGAVVRAAMGAGLSETVRRTAKRVSGGDATVANNRLKNETVARAQNETVAHPKNETVAPGAGAGRTPLAILRATIANRAGLSRGASRVGAAILDQYSPDTGQCAIGAEKIADNCGLSRATVFRAIKALVEAGLFVKVPYGGMGHCNVYVPQFGGAGAKGQPSQNATVVNMRPSQECDPFSDRDIIPSGVKGTAVGRKRRRWETDRRQRSMLLPMAGGKSLPQPEFKPTPEAIRAKAAQRLRRDLAQRHGGRTIADDPDAWLAGIEAEMQVKGSGLAAHDAVLLGALERRRRTGSGPPG